MKSEVDIGARTFKELIEKITIILKLSMNVQDREIFKFVI